MSYGLEAYMQKLETVRKTWVKKAKHTHTHTHTHIVSFIHLLVKIYVGHT